MARRAGRQVRAEWCRARDGTFSGHLVEVVVSEQDPEALTTWYRETLGIGAGCGKDENGETSDWFWYPEPGPVVFAPFKATTDYFAPDKSCMLNLRVRGLPQLIARLESKGLEVITREEWDSPETGRFARIHDPEGNPVELWEPADTAE